MNRLYFDHNATSPLLPEVREALIEFLHFNPGNPSSIHGSGRSIRSRIDEARDHVAKLIGANPLEIVFTSSGVEANHLAWNAFQMPGKKIATTTTEHSCIRGAIVKAEMSGAIVHEISIERDGSISKKTIDDLCAFKPDFLSIHHANNETGALYPIAKYIKQLCSEKCYIHTDAVQTIGKIPVNVNELGVHYLSISGHKIGALQGIGALYVKKGSPLKSLWPGGSQEKGMRSGTENVIGIISMGVAAKTVLKKNFEHEKTIQNLRNEFETQLMKLVPDICITAHEHERIPNTSHILFKNLDAESLLIACDLDGIDIATGSACSSGSIEPSKAVLAMGISPQDAKGAIRFSFGWCTTQNDIEKALRILPKLVEQVRKSR